MRALRAVDLDRKIVWNKLALLWGSPLILLDQGRIGAVLLTNSSAEWGNHLHFLGSFSILKLSSKIANFCHKENCRTKKLGRISPEIHWCYQLQLSYVVWWLVMSRKVYEANWNRRTDRRTNRTTYSIRLTVWLKILSHPGPWKDLDWSVILWECVLKVDFLWWAICPPPLN